MAEVNELLVRIDATTEQLRREMRRADQAVAQSAGHIDRQLGAIDKRFEMLDRAAGFATKALTGYMAVFSVGAVVSWTRNQLDAADAIAKAAEVANLATGSLQELRYAFTQLSTLTDGQVDASLRRFNRRLGLAREEAGPAKAAFDQLFGGVARFGNTEQALDAVIERLASVEDQAQRAALASAFFGDDAGPLLAAALGKGSAAVNQLRQDARELGFVISDDLIDNAGQIKDEFDRAQRILNTSFMSALTAATPILIKMAEMATKIANALTTTPAEAIHNQLEDLRKRQDHLLNELNRPRVLRANPFASDDKLRAELNEVNAEMLELQQQLGTLQQKAAEVPQALASSDWVPPEVLDQFHKLEASLERQLALYGQTSEVAKLRYEMEHGSLQGLNEQQQQRLAGLTAELDAKAALTEQEKELDALRKEIDAASAERMDPALKAEEDYARQLELLESFYEQKLLTEEEWWALEIEAYFNKEAALTKIAGQEGRKREQTEKQIQQQISAFRLQAASSAVGLLRQVTNEGKAAALLTLAAEKALAIASVFIQTKVASMRAVADLGPILGPPMAAKIELWGKTSMGLIAATGLAEATMGGGGGSSGVSAAASGQVEGGAEPAIAPQEERRPVDVNLTIDSRRTLFGRDELEAILDGINGLIKDGAEIGSVRLN